MVTEIQRNALVSAARQAREHAYAPYSNYAVGSAILLEDGQIVTGVNVENASYGLSICAERTAVFKAVAAGARRILGVAVCTLNGGTPCGACRQVMAEFTTEDVPVLICDEQGNVRETSLYSLLPEHFGPGHLV